MFGINEESDRALTALNAFRRKQDKHTIEKLLEEARKHRPGYASGMMFDEFVEVTRANYYGHQSDRLRRLLVQKYPAGGRLMSLVPVNITTEAAELMSQAYRQEPTRRLYIDGVDPMLPGQQSSPQDESRAAAYADLVKKRSSLKVDMQEAERIASLAFSCFVKLRWSQVERQFGRAERLESSLFWPSQVMVIPDPAAPGKLFAARVVMLKLESKAKHDVWEVWTREQVVDSMTDADELELRAGWWYGRFTSEGETVMPFREYELDDLPIVCIKSRPSPHIIPDGDRDLVHLQDDINIRMSDHSYKAAFDSHQQVVISGSQAKPGQGRPIGPGTVLELREGESATTLRSDISNLPLDAIQMLMLFFARSKRLPVDAFWTKEGNPETGVAREIRNLAADQKRAEHVEQLELDEAEMMRIAARIADRFGDLTDERGAAVVIDGDDAMYRTKFYPPKRFEDPAQKQQRLKADREDGIISDARYAVEMGHFDSIEEAVESGLSDVPGGNNEPQQTSESQGQGSRPPTEGGIGDDAG
jgi:antitoxin component of RelBE/YafQ-DinJ toxin-antitoxin module